MKKLSGTTILALLLVLVLGTTVAYATWHWCPDDPKIDIDDEIVTVLYGLDHPTPSAVVSGPVQVEVYVPKKADAEVIEYGSGWGYGEEVEVIHEKGLKSETEVRVKIPTNGHSEFPVVVSVAGNVDSATCEGLSNDWVECNIGLD